LLITIDIMQLLLALLVLAGIVLGIFLIILLARLIRTMGKISQLIGNIQEPVNQTLIQMPGLIKKFDLVAKDVSVLTESANQTVPEILKDAQAITGTARTGVEAIGGAAKSVGEGVSSFFSPAAPTGVNLGTIAEIISQILSIVGVFTGNKKDRNRSRNRKRRRA